MSHPRIFLVLANALYHFLLGACGTQSLVCGALPGRVAARQGTTYQEKSERSEGSVQPRKAEHQTFHAREISGMTHTQNALGGATL